MNSVETGNLMKTIKINGMSCNHCVMAVTKVLNEIQGIENVQINLEKGEASFDEKTMIDMKEVREKIEKAGYQVV